MHNMYIVRRLNIKKISRRVIVAHKLRGMMCRSGIQFVTGCYFINKKSDNKVQSYSSRCHRTSRTVLLLQ